MKLFLYYQKVGIIPQERTDTKDTKAWQPHRLKGGGS